MGELGEDGVGQCGPRRERVVSPLVEVPIGECDEREVGVGVDPEHRAGTAEVPERARRIGRTGPVRLLVAANLETQPPGALSVAAHAGNDTCERRVVDATDLGGGGRVDEGRAHHFGDEPARVGEIRSHAVRGRPAQHAGAHPERGEHGFVEVVGEGHVGGVLDGAGGEAEAAVGVDPGRFGSGDRVLALEGVAAGVGEEVPQRAAGLADGLVEGDDALFDGDEDRPRRHRLGQRGESLDAFGVADGRDDGAGAQDGGGDVGDRPVGGEVEGRHRGHRPVR